MNYFQLRLPTIEDWETALSVLSHSDFDPLHRSPVPVSDGILNHREFHLANPHPDDPTRHAIAGDHKVDGQYKYTQSAQEKLMFRPVLEAPEEISCLKDGTSLKMGCFKMGTNTIPIPNPNELPFKWPERNQFGGPTLALFPHITGREEDAINWIKCGNILMADRCLISDISFERLKEMGLDTGCEVLVPFDETVSKYFYDLAKAQPESPQRLIGDIMRQGDNELGEEETALRDPNLLYNLAIRIHECWLSWDQALDDVIMHTTDLAKEGLSTFAWRNAENQIITESFSPAAVQKVLSNCSQDTFNYLVVYQAANSFLDLHDFLDVQDKHGHQTEHGRLLEQLQRAEAALSKQDKPLARMIQNATGRAAQANSSGITQTKTEAERSY